MGQDSSYPCSWEPPTCPSPQPGQFSPHPCTIFFRSTLMLYVHLRLGLPSGFFPSDFSKQFLFASLHTPSKVTSSPVHWTLSYCSRTLTWLWDDRSGFDSWHVKAILYFLDTPKPSLAHNQPPIQRMSTDPFQGAKQPSREADHSPLPCAETKNERCYTSTPPYTLIASTGITEPYLLPYYSTLYVSLTASLNKQVTLQLRITYVFSQYGRAYEGGQLEDAEDQAVLTGWRTFLLRL